MTEPLLAASGAATAGADCSADGSAGARTDANAGLLAGPLRLLVLPVLIAAEDAPGGLRCVLVRHCGSEAPSLLSAALLDTVPASWRSLTAPPAGALTGAIADVVAVAVRSRLSLSLAGAPAVTDALLPVRMDHPRKGRTGAGWLLPVGVRVKGAPEADPLIDDYVLLSPAEALAALPTSLERTAAAAALTVLGIPAA